MIMYYFCTHPENNAKWEKSLPVDILIMYYFCTLSYSIYDRLLVAHGKLDDNVHFQHTEKLLAALNRHHKPFRLQVKTLDLTWILLGIASFCFSYQLFIDRKIDNDRFVSKVEFFWFTHGKVLKSMGAQ